MNKNILVHLGQGFIRVDMLLLDRLLYAKVSSDGPPINALAAKSPFLASR